MAEDPRPAQSDDNSGEESSTRLYGAHTNLERISSFLSVILAIVGGWQLLIRFGSDWHWGLILSLVLVLMIFPAVYFLLSSKRSERMADEARRAKLLAAEKHMVAMRSEL